MDRLCDRERCREVRHVATAFGDLTLQAMKRVVGVADQLVVLGPHVARRQRVQTLTGHRPIVVDYLDDLTDVTVAARASSDLDDLPQAVRDGREQVDWIEAGISRPATATLQVRGEPQEYLAGPPRPATR